jgi:hypothetical protein
MGLPEGRKLPGREREVQGALEPDSLRCRQAERSLGHAFLPQGPRASSLEREAQPVPRFLRWGKPCPRPWRKDRRPAVLAVRGWLSWSQYWLQT